MLFDVPIFQWQDSHGGAKPVDRLTERVMVEAPDLDAATRLALDQKRGRGYAMPERVRCFVEVPNPC